MPFEDRIKSICSECIGCPYKSKNLEHKCEYLANVMHGWELGNKDAIEKASLYVYHLGAHPNVTIDGMELEKSFKEYMEEQQ